MYCPRMRLGNLYASGNENTGGEFRESFHSNLGISRALESYAKVKVFGMGTGRVIFSKITLPAYFHPCIPISLSRPMALIRRRSFLLLRSFWVQSTKPPSPISVRCPFTLSSSLKFRPR